MEKMCKDILFLIFNYLDDVDLEKVYEIYPEIINDYIMRYKIKNDIAKYYLDTNKYKKCLNYIVREGYFCKECIKSVGTKRKSDSFLDFFRGCSIFRVIDTKRYKCEELQL